MESDPESAQYILRIEPDYCVKECTHLIGNLGHTVIIEQLTPQVSDLIVPVIGQIMIMGVRTFTFDEKNTPAFEIDGKSVEMVFQDHEQALEAFRLTAWWLEWKRRRFIIQARCRDAKDHSLLKWRCLDCGKEVPIERTHCYDPDCPSWNKVHLTTGEPTLQLVPQANSA